jgi:hypothetical protein
MSIIKNISVIATVFVFSFGLAQFDCANSASYSKPSAPTTSFRPSISSVPSYSKPSTVYSKPDVSAKPSNTVDKPVGPNVGYSKPIPEIDKTKPFVPPTQFSGYSKPGSQQTSQTPVQPKIYSSSVLASQSSKVMSGDALAKYQAERAQAKTPPQPVDINAARRDPIFAQSTSRYSNINSYMYDRNRSISIYQQSHPNVYIISRNMYPNYGMYDSSFLNGMVMGAIGTEAANLLWMYAHQNDSWYNQWHSDLVAQSQNNTDLKAKLDQLEAQLATMKSNNVPISPSSVSLPEGVSPALAIAPETMIANASLQQEEQNSEGGHFLLYTIIFVLTMLTLGGVTYLYMVGRKK